MDERISKLAARVRDLERKHALLVRYLHQALADLDAACAQHFDVPAASSGWQPPAQDSDEAEARAQAQQRRRKGGA